MSLEGYRTDCAAVLIDGVLQERLAAPHLTRHISRMRSGRAGLAERRLQPCIRCGSKSPGDRSVRPADAARRGACSACSTEPGSSLCGARMATVPCTGHRTISRPHDCFDNAGSGKTHADAEVDIIRTAREDSLSGPGRVTAARARCGERKSRHIFARPPRLLPPDPK